MAKAAKKKQKKKAAPERDKGKPVRLSYLVLETLDKKRRGKEGFDAVLRRLLGLPNRRGTAQILRSFWLLPQKLIVRKSRAEAKGEAVLASVRSGKKKVMEAPIRVTETP